MGPEYTWEHYWLGPLWLRDGAHGRVEIVGRMAYGAFCRWMRDDYGLIDRIYSELGADFVSFNHDLNSSCVEYAVSVGQHVQR